MRDYPHQPDTDYLTQIAPAIYQAVEQLDERVERDGLTGWPELGTEAVRAGWQAFALSWAQQQPIDETDGYLLKSAEWALRTLATTPRELALDDAVGLLWSFLVAGDWQSMRKLTARIPESVVLESAAGRSVLDEITVTARLADLNDPSPAIESLRDQLADPGSDTQRISAAVQLAEALTETDQAGFDNGLAALLRWHVEHYATPDGRRDPLGLVSMTASVYAALAVSKGLSIPADDPYLPARLLGWRVE